MKKIKRRAYSALLIALCLLFGMGVYVYRFATQNEAWVTYSANQNLFVGGKLVTGTLTDRNGIVLADIKDGKRSFAESQLTRVASLHVVGDTQGNIGTGALVQFADRLTGYSALTGISAGGATAALTIDADLQDAAYTALAGRKGAVLLMDYSSGEILCMVSTPTYDPLSGFDADDPWYESVYLNRAISVAYTPGSVFKLVTLAAAIEHIDDLYERTFYCAGSTMVDGNQIKCTGVHGEQTIEQALAHSCNCAFAQLGLELGSERIREYAAKLGLIDAQSLNGIETAAGNYEDAPDGSAALAWSGIGQSTDLVCPYSMLRAVSAIANAGELCQPTLLLDEHGGSERILRSDTADEIKAMMHYNVVAGYGESNYPGLKLCAKSGTAETGAGTSHAWFTGFLDDSTHPYAFVVVIEDGGGGARNAGPVANAVLQAAVKK